MSEKIGLEAVLQDRAFQAALSSYMSGLDRMQRGTEQAAGGIGSTFGRLGDTIQNALSSAMGFLTANVIQRGLDALGNLVNEAYDAVAAHERLGMSLEALVAREIKYSSAVEKVQTVGQARVSLTEKEQNELAKLKDRYDDLSYTIPATEEKVKQYVNSGKHADALNQEQIHRLNELKEEYANVGTRIAELTAKDGALVNVTKKSIEYQINMNQALAMAGPKAKELLNWIERLGIESPFTSEDIGQAFRLSMAYGFTTDEAKRLTQALTDFAAGSGQTSEVTKRIALSLGQIKAAGKVSGMELRELANAGIPVKQILANAFGVTTAELVEMQEKGLVPADKALEAIVKTLEEDFGGTAKRQAISLAGLKASLEELRTISIRELFGGIFDVLQPKLAALVNLMSSDQFRAGLNAIGKSLGASLLQGLTALERMVAVVGPVFEQIGRGGPTSVKWEAFMPEDLASRVYRVAQSVEDLLTGFKRLSQGDVWGAVNLGISSLLELGDAAGLPIPYLEALGTEFSLMRDILMAVFGTGKAIVDDFATNFATRFGLISQTITVVADAVSRIFLAGVLAMRRAWDENGEAIMSRTREAFETIRAIILSVIDTVAPYIQSWAREAQVVFEQIWPTIAEIVVNAIEIIQDIINAVLPRILNFWHEHGADLMRIVDNTFQWVLGTIRTVINVVAGIIRAVLDVIHGDWAGAWEEIKNVLDLVWIWIKDTVSRGIENVKSILQVAWDTIGPTVTKAWNGFVTTIANKILEIVGKIETFASDVATTLEKLPGRMVSIGEDVIQGFLDGMKNLWGDVLKWINDKLGSLPEPVRKVLGIASPSTIMAQIGREFIEGFLVGLDEKKVELYQAVAELGSTIAQAIGDWADLAQRFGRGWTATGLATTIDRFIADITAAMEKLAPALKNIHDKLLHGSEQATKATVELVNDLFGMFQAVQDGLTALGQTGGMPDLTHWVAWLGTTMTTLVTKLNDLAKTLGPEALGAAAQAGLLVSAVFAPIEQITQAMTSVAQHVVAANPLESILAWIGEMRVMGKELLNRWGAWMAEQYQTAAKAAEAGKAVAAVYAPIEEISKNMQIVSQHLPSRDPLAAILAWIAEMRTMGRELLARWANWTVEQFQQAAAAARAGAAVAAVFAPIQQIADGMTAIINLPAMQPGVIETNTAKLLSFVSKFIQSMVIIASKFTSEGLTAVTTFSTSAGQAFSMASGALSALGAIADLATAYISPPKVDTIVNIMLYLLQSLAWLAYQLAPELITAAAIFAQYAGGVFDFFKTAADALNEIATKAIPDQKKIDAFVSALAHVYNDFATAVGISQGINAALGELGGNLGIPIIGLPALPAPPTRPQAPQGGWGAYAGRPSGGGGGAAGGTIQDLAPLALNHIADMLVRTVTLPIVTAIVMPQRLESLARAAGGGGNNYTLQIYTSAKYEPIVADFAMLQALG